MDLFSILGSSFRRWYVTLPIVALAAVLAVQAYQAVPTVYSSSVTVTVLPPVVPPPPPPDPVTGEVVEPYETNPYDGPSLAAAVLARNLNSAAFAEQLGLDTESKETILADPASRQPIIEITATGGSPGAVLGLLGEVTTQAGTILNTFQEQAGATEGARYRLAPAVPANPVQDVTPSRFRTSGAIAVVGLGVAAAAATALDMALERRRTTPRAPRPRTSGAPRPTGRVGGAARAIGAARGLATPTAATAAQDAATAPTPPRASEADDADADLGRTDAGPSRTNGADAAQKGTGGSGAGRRGPAIRLRQDPHTEAPVLGPPR
ncbi:hypothetical protein [Georgenia sp. SYP-B2076]|uniref:hypothetical protein n=1 Tax=Georgenia sp. SYP-B2076 TaxID=2495881 RepID=UPI000F8DFA96|nr:hypothetical protein [Georgenia sp. SYP-B2076]